MKFSSNTSKENKKENESAKPNPIIENIKSRYILSKIYNNITIKKKLKIVKCNNKIQNRLNLSIKDYKEYYDEIEIEIIPKKSKYGEFIKVDENDKLYYHIYFNDNKKEIKNKYRIKEEDGVIKHEYYIEEEDKVTKIEIIIDYQVKSFQKLFYKCYCIESINFKKFYRNNISDMSWIFCDCSSLKELKLNNFNTNNVTNMSFMFCGCSSLKELNLSNFNTNNVTSMSCMFYFCSSLKELNLSNFNINNLTNMRGMFSECSDNLQTKIKSENKNIKDEAFNNDVLDLYN